jgi:hypothetical protein
MRYLCLLAHCCVQHILCCVFVLSVFVLCTLCRPYLAIVCFRLVYPMLPVSRDCPFLIATSVFTNVLFKSYVYPKACINCYLSISTGLDNKRDDFNFPIVILFVFVMCLVCPMLPVSLDCPFLITLRFSLTFISTSVLISSEQHFE